MDAEKERYVILHRADFIQDVSAVMAIVDCLGTMVHSEIYAEIQGEKTRQIQMRILYSKVLEPGGTAISAAFYNALKKHQPFLLEKHAVSTDVNIMDGVSSEQDSTLETLEERILDALKELLGKELEEFHFYLRQPRNLEGLQPIPRDSLENTSKIKTAELIVQTYPNRAEKIMTNVLTKIKRNDLLGRFRSIP